ncbi:hypothetical protein V6Z11_D13G143800 [Gossypium hirsutum]
MQLLYVITITLPHPRLPNTCFPLFCYSVFCPCPQAFDSPTPPCTGCCSSNSSPISLVTGNFHVLKLDSTARGLRLICFELI